jgi:threonine/homoserine efflux transporter RhtA
MWIIVLGSVVPFLLVLLAVGRLGPARVGLIGMLEPVGAGIIAWVLLGESLNTAQVIGSLIVLVGIALAETSRQAAQRQRTAYPSPDEREVSVSDTRVSIGDTKAASPLPEGMAP